VILEGLVEVVLPAIGRFIAYCVVELFFQFVCYSVGFVVLRAVTLGRYPEKYIPRTSDTNQEIYVIIIGLTALVLFILLVVANYGS
jgi:hypothetical protein